MTAIFYAVLLFRCFNQARSDGEVVGSLTEKVISLEKELANRNALLDYLSGLLMGRRAKTRTAQQNLLDKGDEK